MLYNVTVTASLLTPHSFYTKMFGEGLHARPNRRYLSYV